MSQEDGSVEIAVGHESGRVFLRFKEPMHWIACDPGNAIQIAEAMTAAAFEADTGLKPLGPALKASLVQRHRDILIPRIALMLGTLRDDKLQSNGDVALKIMDSVCNEVFG